MNDRHILKIFKAEVMSQTQIGCRFLQWKCHNFCFANISCIHDVSKVQNSHAWWMNQMFPLFCGKSFVCLIKHFPNLSHGNNSFAYMFGNWKVFGLCASPKRIILKLWHGDNYCFVDRENYSAWCQWNYIIISKSSLSTRKFTSSINSYSAKS